MEIKARLEKLERGSNLNSELCQCVGFADLEILNYDDPENLKVLHSDSCLDCAKAFEPARLAAKRLELGTRINRIYGHQKQT